MPGGFCVLAVMMLTNAAGPRELLFAVSVPCRVAWPQVSLAVNDLGLNWPVLPRGNIGTSSAYQCSFARVAISPDRLRRHGYMGHNKR